MQLKVLKVLTICLYGEFTFFRGRAGVVIRVWFLHCQSLRCTWEERELCSGSFWNPVTGWQIPA